MIEYPTFSNAPITEALLDIQVLLPVNVDLAKIETVQSRVEERYPIKQNRYSWQIQAVAMDDSQPEVTQSGGVIGYMFFPPAPSHDRVFQARRDGFTFSKLRPYESWNAFQAESKELWKVYAEVLQPIQIKRLALRTVNVLNLPLPFADFKEYILTTPEVAPGIPSGLANFFMQMAIPQPGGEIAIVTSALQPAQQLNPAFVTLTFDIDVFVEQDFSPASDVFWERCEDLRQVRNAIFFNSLTDKAKELF